MKNNAAATPISLIGGSSRGFEAAAAKKGHVFCTAAIFYFSSSYSSYLGSKSNMSEFNPKGVIFKKGGGEQQGREN